VPGGRRVAPRLRYDRLGAAVSSLLITVVTLLAGVGVLPVSGPEAPVSADAAVRTASDKAPVGTSVVEARPEETALPARSGTGKRVVFSLAEQRIWLVRADGTVRSTYLASGSLTDNLEPGTYAVYSRSRHAIGIDDSGEMEYFVRFAHGKRAAIGFHSIPTKDGKLLQTVDELGTPTSHGCIRQETRDARRLWNFAPVDTTVVVTA
jgi:lipoprotein-anchoring transpeptidase ErfK/SrfK